MPKRSRKKSQLDAEDNPIGLTSAFEPVDEEDDFLLSGKHARHARYSTEDDDEDTAGGDTNDTPEEGASGSTDKDAINTSGEDKDESTNEKENMVNHSDEGGIANENTNNTPNEDEAKSEAVEEVTDKSSQTHADDNAQAPKTDDASNRGEKPIEPDKTPAETPEYVRRSRRMRRILIIVIIILIVVIALAAFLVYNLVEASQDEAEKLVQEGDETTLIDNSDSTEDLPTTTVKTTSAPDLLDLLGLTLDEAVAELGNGAEVTTTQEVNEEDNPVKSQSRVALTSEVTTDMGSNIPTVYLDFDEGGKVIQAGYSVATAALGYGSMSFADAINNEHIIELTLAEAGIDVDSSNITLPEDKSAYSTYDSNDALTKEYYSFSGNVDVENKTYEWSAVLSYDYASANATGNLSDTIRVIYVYIGD